MWGLHVTYYSFPMPAIWTADTHSSVFTPNQRHLYFFFLKVFVFLFLIPKIFVFLFLKVFVFLFLRVLIFLFLKVFVFLFLKEFASFFLKVFVFLFLGCRTWELQEFYALQEILKRIVYWFPSLNCCYIHLSCLDPVKSLVQLDSKNK